MSRGERRTGNEEDAEVIMLNSEWRIARNARRCHAVRVEAARRPGTRLRHVAIEGRISKGDAHDA